MSERHLPRIENDYCDIIIVCEYPGCPARGWDWDEVHALPADPPASETVEAAWEAMWAQHEDAADYCGFNRATFDAHRPRIEAAIRAEGLDVEQLARAILGARWYANDNIEDAHIAAGRIAAEYARLEAEG